MKKVKNILFRADIKGQGIVNYDNGEQKFIFKDTALKNMHSHNDNNMYAKKDFYNDDKGDLNYRIKISGDCMRNNIFRETVPCQSPNISKDPTILHSFIGSTTSLLRGYLFAGNTEETVKRKSPITLVDAIQTCNAVSTMEFFSKSGFKDANSLFRRETVGAISYQTTGSINLDGLQFISTDKIFDRYALNPDNFKIYKMFLGTQLKNFNSEIGYYKYNTSNVQLVEQGILLSNENINQLVKEFMVSLLKMNITKNKAYARISKLEYKLVYDPLEDTFDNDKGWVKMVKEADFKPFDSEIFYTESDEDSDIETHNMMIESFITKVEERKDAKNIKAEETKERKRLAATKKAESEGTTVIDKPVTKKKK